MKNFNNYEVSLPDILIKTEDYKYIKYPFEYFNKVQSLIVEKKYYEYSYNLVLATNTSTGKTICAELFMGYVLYAQKRKVIYVSPLKSLTQEKYDDWQVKFKDKKVCILTSDYSDDTKILKKLRESDIICFTSEMLDSKTRSIKNLLEWGKNVGLIIIDEFHIIDMENRGHAVEAGLIRFCKYLKDLRIMCLSATVPNVNDFRKWFTRLNKKPTLVIKSNWRPVQLDFHYQELLMQHDYHTAIREKCKLVHDKIIEKNNEKFLIFVHDKYTGRQLTTFLNRKHINCEFHNADLSFKERQKLEKDFSDKENGNRIMVSTSTLAWGRTLPARNVIIAGSMRGKITVDEFDILQMSGRAGRLGIDKKGDCYFLTHNVQLWKSLLKNLKDVNSSLMEKDYLEFQITAEVAINSVNNVVDLQEWYHTSLAAIQEKGSLFSFNECLVDLEAYNMIQLHNNNIQIKPLGKVSAFLYFLPKDIVNFSKKLKKINDNFNDYTIAYLLSYQQSWSLPYLPRNSQEENKKFIIDFKNKTGISIKPCAVTYNVFKYLKYSEKNTFNFQVTRDIKRIDAALSWIASIKNLNYESLI